LKNLSLKHIKFNYLSRKNELRKVSALAATFLCVSATWATECIKSNVPEIKASQGVDFASHISSEPNGKSALLYDFNDMIMIDLGAIIPKGESYRIRWKKKSTPSDSSYATLKVMESNLESNFSPQSFLPKSKDNDSFVVSEFNALRDTRYIMINVASPVDDAIEIDAVYSVSKGTTDKSYPKEFIKKEKYHPNHTKGKKQTSSNSSERTSVVLFKKGSDSYSVLQCNLKKPEITLVNPRSSIPLRDFTMIANCYKDYSKTRIKPFYATNGKTGDPPEHIKNLRGSNSIIDIRPPPI